MRIGIIGRTEILYETATLLKKRGHEINFIITSKEAPEYTKTSEDFRNLAEQWRIPFLSSGHIAEQLPLIREANSDVAVSINCTSIIPQTVIDCFPLGILNAHGGDLPRYRGNACQAWAILKGESRIGLCIHKMRGGDLDSGDIIVREHLVININTKVTQVWAWMRQRIPEMFVEALKRLEIDPSYILEHQSTDPRDALRCYPRRPEDGRINWSKPAKNIIRLINASNKPYAGAFCEFEGEKITIWDAELVSDDTIFLAVPGQVTKVGEGFVEVACGKGKIRINCVENNGILGGPNHWFKSIRKRLT